MHAFESDFVQIFFYQIRGYHAVDINTCHQCITAMNQYENKSLEELRVEDYLAGTKGPTPNTSAPVIIFQLVCKLNIFSYFSNFSFRTWVILVEKQADHLWGTASLPLSQ